MTAARDWVAGARPRTLPAAVVPVAVGSGVAAGYGQFGPWRAAAALIVALALQVGVNYANDFSDGVRGTDQRRVGPVRLVGSGLAAPGRVLGAALISFAVACAVGLLACALLVINNLRDIPGDELSGKRTLAVVIGERRTRLLYVGCVTAPFCAAAAIAPACPATLLTLAALPFGIRPARRVLAGVTGRDLIAALAQTGRLQLAFGALLTAGLAIRP